MALRWRLQRPCVASWVSPHGSWRGPMLDPHCHFSPLEQSIAGGKDTSGAVQLWLLGTLLAEEPLVCVRERNRPSLEALLASANGKPLAEKLHQVVGVYLEGI